MNFMKRLIPFFFLMTAAIYTTSAQEVLSPEQKQEIVENVGQFISDLNLSEQDKPEFRFIMTDFFIGLVALRATNFSPQTNTKILKTLVKGRDSRVKALLSKEQYKVYKARVKERQANIRAFMKEQR